MTRRYGAGSLGHSHTNEFWNTLLTVVGDLREDFLSRARVIVADDHPDMLKAVVRLLECEYEVVTTVRDGAAALEAVAVLTPDVVVLDISMPVLTGIEVARRLKTSGSNVRIVFLTVHEDPDFAQESLEAGGWAFVTKSRMTTDLRLAISEALAGRLFVSHSGPHYS